MYDIMNVSHVFVTTKKRRNTFEFLSRHILNNAASLQEIVFLEMSSFVCLCKNLLHFPKLSFSTFDSDSRHFFLSVDLHGISYR